jgi:hypothetical protein
MNENAFCLTIFYGGEQFIFSRHPMLKSENKKQEQQLRALLGENASNLFPIKYKTEFKNKAGDLISGNFVYGGAET